MTLARHLLAYSVRVFNGHVRNRFFGPKYPSLPWISYRATERQRSLLRRLDPSPSPAIHAAPSRISRRRRRRPRASPDPTPPSRVQELSSWLRRPGGMRAAQSRSGVRAAALRGTLAGISCGRVCPWPPARKPTCTAPASRRQQALRQTLQGGSRLLVFIIHQPS